SSVLIWVVIFNHLAESPTFVIAMFGAALWGVLEPPSAARAVGLVLTLSLTSLSSTDLVPRPLRRAIIRPYGIKALPSFVLWGDSFRRLVYGAPRPGDMEAPPDPPERVGPRGIG